jgi:hypothetical protein
MTTIEGKRQKDNKQWLTQHYIENFEQLIPQRNTSLNSGTQERIWCNYSKSVSVVLPNEYIIN